MKLNNFDDTVTAIVPSRLVKIIILQLVKVVIVTHYVSVRPVGGSLNGKAA